MHYTFTTCLLLCLFGTINASDPYAFEPEQPEPVVKKKLSRHELIAQSAQQCKIPCWTQSYQIRYPRCPFTKCNSDYDETMHQLFSPGGQWDTSGDRKKKYCIDAIRGGYSCLNMYKFLCPLATMAAGNQIKTFCAAHLLNVISVDALHPRVQPCAAAAPFCMLQFCCSVAARRCDYCILDFLSNRNTYGPMSPKIEDV